MTSLTEAYYRRLYSFHEPTEEFYAKDQPRDKDGKWVRGGRGSKTDTPVRHKVWSGISPAPGDRVPPTNTLRRQPFDSMSSGFMTKLGRRIYDADLGDGYRSKVVEVSPSNDNSMYVRGYIYKGKDQVGAFERTMIQKDGKLIANHDDLEINSSHQGKGVGDRFNAHAVAEYQRLGVDKITLHAGLEVGGYAWARQGFRYNDEEAPGARQKFLNSRLDQISSYARLLPVLQPHKAELDKQIAALRKAIDAGEDVQPIHIAALGEKFKYKMYDDNSNAYTTWPGKQSLLGSSWSGAYYFDAANPITASATSLEHAALRQPEENLVLLRESVHEFFNKYHDHKDGRFSSGKSTKSIDDGTRYRAPGSKDHEWKESTHQEDRSGDFPDETYIRYTTKLSNGLEARLLIPESLASSVQPEYFAQIRNEIGDGLEIAQAAYPKDGYTQDHINVRVSRYDPTVDPYDRGSSMGAVEGLFEGFKPSEINVYGPAIGLERQSADDGWSPAVSQVSVLTYTTVHESGHILSENGPHGAQRPQRAPVASNLLSEYAQTSKAEAYAESFAEWSITKGETTNKFALAQAKKYGWAS